MNCWTLIVGKYIEGKGNMILYMLHKCICVCVSAYLWCACVCVRACVCACVPACVYLHVCDHRANALKASHSKSKMCVHSPQPPCCFPEDCLCIFGNQPLASPSPLGLAVYFGRRGWERGAAGSYLGRKSFSKTHLVRFQMVSGKIFV